MKAILSTALLALAVSGFAQVPEVPPFDPNLPPQRAPRLPASTSAPASLPPSLRSARAPGDTNVFLTNLLGVIIVPGRSNVYRTGALPIFGIEVRGIELLKSADFPPVLAPYLYKPLSIGGIRDMQDDIILYCRAKNHPLVDVILLPQVVDNGVIQLWFLEGKIGNVLLANEGWRWFSGRLIRQQLRLRGQEAVDSAKLLEDLDWLNRNPFRDVRVAFQPGRAPGESDLTVNVNDRLPVRPYFGYENTGTEVTGEDRLLFGVNWGNAFGLDHLFSYQYMADVAFDLLSAHSLSYVVPLPWRHLVTVSGAHVEADADLGPEIRSTGTSWQIGLRYAVPLPRLGRYQHEVSGGFDFKRSDNDFEFGGASIAPTAADLTQFAAAYGGVRPDRWGQTSVGLDLFAGGLGGTSGDLRTDAASSYVYARLSAGRLTRLPADCSWDVKGLLQLSGARLLPSEELGIGGQRTVRGYSERLANGDRGWILNNELRSPAWRVSNLMGRHGSGDYVQLLTFLDYGEVRANSRTPDDLPDATLTSVGVGLRYTLSKNLSFRFDYGWQLTDKNLSDAAGAGRSRAHIGVLASY